MHGNMYWIDTNDGRYTITGKTNREVKVHGVCGHTISVTIELGCGTVLDGNMCLIDFIDMMESA